MTLIGLKLPLRSYATSDYLKFLIQGLGCSRKPIHIYFINCQIHHYKKKHKSLIPHTLNQLKPASQSQPIQSTNGNLPQILKLIPLTDDVEPQARQVSGT
jgi:hypothetical protein